MEQSNGYWRSTANRQEQENKKKTNLNFQLNKYHA